MKANPPRIPYLLVCLGLLAIAGCGQSDTRELPGAAYSYRIEFSAPGEADQITEENASEKLAAAIGEPVRVMHFERVDGVPAIIVQIWFDSERDQATLERKLADVEGATKVEKY